MFTKDVNKELSHVLSERNKKQSNLKQTGFNRKLEETDSDEDDSEIQTNKSTLKSPKSQSSRSSLLSAKSPRDDSSKFMNTMKNPFIKNKRFDSADSKNRFGNDNENEDKRSQATTPRRDFKLWNQERSMSPKSPKSPKSEKSDASPGRFSKSLSNRFDQSEESLPSSRRNLKSPIHGGDNFMLSTLRKPLNTESKLLNERSPRNELKRSPKGLVKLQFDTNEYPRKEPSYERIKRKDESPSDKSNISLKLGSENRDRKKKYFDDDENSRDSNSKVSFEKSMNLLTGLLPENDEIDHHKKPIEKKQKQQNHLPKEKNIEFSDDFNVEMQHEYEKQLSDIDHASLVDEKIEDDNITEKLIRQRKEKTRQRLERAKTQTESTKQVESAIEQVTFANEDNARLAKLTQKYDELDYPTKPKIDNTKLLTDNSLTFRNRSSDRNGSSLRTRSLSGSRRFKTVKPKIVTRPVLNNTNNEESFNESLFHDEQDINDSNILRQEVYRRWYEKKMMEAKENLKQMRNTVKNEEERKAHELINKIKKSQIKFKEWQNEKESIIKEKSASAKQLENKIKEEIEKRNEKKMVATKAFNKWKETKDEYLKEQIAEKRKKEKLIKDAQLNINKKKAEAEKMYNIWKKNKEVELQEKMKDLKNKMSEAEKKELIEESKKELNRKAYDEWLEKKERDGMYDKNMSHSMNSDINLLPPFYPTSRTISYRR